MLKANANCRHRLCKSCIITAVEKNDKDEVILFCKYDKGGEKVWKCPAKSCSCVLNIDSLKFAYGDEIIEEL